MGGWVERVGGLRGCVVGERVCGLRGWVCGLRGGG